MIRPSLVSGFTPSGLRTARRVVLGSINIPSVHEAIVPYAQATGHDQPNLRHSAAITKPIG